VEDSIVANPTAHLTAASAPHVQSAGPVPRPGAAADPSAPSFGALLKQAVGDALEAGHRSEAATLQAAAGRADLQGVVEAVNAAEITLQTVVALRDRMISAYQEIIRMPM
jgi:flagellar hook-basal body complex protein FliE